MACLTITVRSVDCHADLRHWPDIETPCHSMVGWPGRNGIFYDHDAPARRDVRLAVRGSKVERRPGNAPSLEAGGEVVAVLPVSSELRAERTVSAG